MKKNRLYFGMLILMLVAVIIWAFYNMLNVGKQETSYRVSVVVENSNSDRWTSLRQGLEQAARDYNISLSFVSTGSFSTAMEEMDVVKKQVTNGANGIILQMNTDHAGQELEDLYDQVEAEVAYGGTDIYYAAMEGLRQLKNYDLSQYTPAIILLTDGVSDGSFSDFRDGYEAFGADVPVFSIMFGSADPTQLEELAELTHARVFDGREDLIGAFRSVKGYN